MAGKKKPQSEQPLKRNTPAVIDGTCTETSSKPAKRIAYSKELAELICEKMLERDEDDNTRSLRAVCREAGMPKEATVYQWLNLHKEFAEMYARTRETLAEMNAIDIIEIADTDRNYQRARNRIDARKWWASKVAPKKYGEKLDVKHDASDAFLSMWNIVGQGGAPA